MKKKKPDLQPATLLRASVNTFANNPIIIYPLVVLGFIQLLALELLYFAPRFPLNVFFAPIIRRLYSEIYLHYPLNLSLLPKLFRDAQLIIYLFIGSFLSALAIQIIASINQEKKMKLRTAIKRTLPLYIDILCSTALYLLVVFGLSKSYNFLVLRALRIRSETGIYALIKNTIIVATPYANLLLGIFVTTVLIFVIPIIVIEKKKFFTAIFLNFRHLFKHFWFMFIVVALPTLLYVPILLIKGNLAAVVGEAFPTIYILGIILSLVVSIIIDITVLTASTTYYLHLKEK